jgi:hypothetical protein
MFFGRDASIEGLLNPKFRFPETTPLEAFEGYDGIDRKLDWVLKFAWLNIVDVIVFVAVNLDRGYVEKRSHGAA